MWKCECGDVTKTKKLSVKRIPLYSLLLLSSHASTRVEVLRYKTKRLTDAFSCLALTTIQI